MTQPSFNPHGAVDLSALAARTSAAQARQATSAAGGAPGHGASGNGAAGGTAGAGASGVVIDVTEATFEAEVIRRSLTVPVVIDFWAEWCGPCKQLSPVLERLAVEYGGRFVLAKIDTDANQQLAAAAQVQSIPAVLAVVGGQPVPLFVGALPEAQVRQYLDALLAEALKMGVTGRVDVGTADPMGAAGAPAPAEPPGDPRLDEAYDAIERGDYDAAAAQYRAMLSDRPADAMARAGLAQIELLRRIDGVDLDAAVADALARPDDVAANLLAADVEASTGAPERAFDRLVGLVRRTSGDERDQVRARLLELFEVVGGDDPTVVRARAALASALF